jgi:hypothetical protein
VAVTFAKAAVIARHRRFNQTHRVAGGSLETVLAEADSYGSFRAAAEGRVSP